MIKCFRGDNDVARTKLGLWALICCALLLVGCDETYEHFGFQTVELKTKHGFLILKPEPLGQRKYEVEGKTINVIGPAQSITVRFDPVRTGPIVKSVRLKTIVFQDPNHVWRLTRDNLQFAPADANGDFIAVLEDLNLQWVVYKLQLALVVTLEEGKEVTLELSTSLEKRYAKADHNYYTKNIHGIKF